MVKFIHQDINSCKNQLEGFIHSIKDYFGKSAMIISRGIFRIQFLLSILNRQLYIIIQHINN
jgi:hypothetical protein